MRTSRNFDPYLATVPLAAITISLLWLSVSFIAVKRFDASYQVLGYIGSGMHALYAVLCLVLGRLLARCPAKPKLVVTCVLYVLIGVAALHAKTLWQFCALVIALGLPGSVYWPTIEHVMCAGRTMRQMRRSLGSFNVLWSAGGMCGILLAGWLYEVNPRLPFYVVCALTCTMLTVFLLAGSPRLAGDSGDEAAPREGAQPQEVAPATMTAFLYLSRVMNFLSFFALASFRFLFPRYADHVGFDTTTVGTLLTVMLLAQTATFLLLRNTGFWHYRLWPLLAASALTAGSFFIAGSAGTRYLVIVPLFCSGVLGGFCYTSSIYYSMARPKAGVESAARHEMTVGMGAALGPVVAGYLTDRTGDPATLFILSGVVALIIFGVALQFLIRSLRNAGAG